MEKFLNNFKTFIKIFANFILKFIKIILKFEYLKFKINCEKRYWDFEYVQGSFRKYWPKSNYIKQ